MEIKLQYELLKGLTYRGVLAYVAIQALGDGSWTTAQLGQAVSCNSSLMLEGMHELLAAGLICKQRKTKWPIGTGVASEERVQILDLSAIRRQDLLDDLKRAYEWANEGFAFTMNASDGKAVVKWLKDNPSWGRPDWRKALNNRYKSEGIVKTQQMYLWLGRLSDYREAPLDRYGKVMVNGGGKIGEAITREQGNRNAREAAVAAAGAKS